MDFVPFAAAGVLIIKLIDFIRYASARDINAVVTQLAVWIAGVLGVMLLANTAWARGLTVAGVPLSALGFWSQVFYGMSLSSTGSIVNDFKKAIDNSNSAFVPTLLPTRYVGTHRVGPGRAVPPTPPGAAQ